MKLHGLAEFHHAYLDWHRASVFRRAEPAATS